jgi:hypothetical protein
MLKNNILSGDVTQTILFSKNKMTHKKRLLFVFSYKIQKSHRDLTLSPELRRTEN